MSISFILFSESTDSFRTHFLYFQLDSLTSVESKAPRVFFTKLTILNVAEPNKVNIEPRNTMLGLNGYGISCYTGDKMINPFEI